MTRPTHIARSPIHQPIQSAARSPASVSCSRITCIDLDRVVEHNCQLDARVQTIVERCDFWTEIAPSGARLHIFVCGAVSETLKGSQIEVYSTARYIAVTGHQCPARRRRFERSRRFDHLVRASRPE